jgi:hypothetical protein
MIRVRQRRCLSPVGIWRHSVYAGVEVSANVHALGLQGLQQHIARYSEYLSMDFAHGILLVRRFYARRLAPVDAGNVCESRPVYVADGDVVATAVLVLIERQEAENGLGF